MARIQSVRLCGVWPESQFVGRKNFFLGLPDFYVPQKRTDISGLGKSRQDLNLLMWSQRDQNLDRFLNHVVVYVEAPGGRSDL